MAYYKVVLRGGHVGAGKSHEFVRYCEAQDVMSVFLESCSLSRVKKKRGGTGICSVEPVSHEEYHKGRRRERHDPYLHRKRA